MKKVSLLKKAVIMVIAVTGMSVATVCAQQKGDMAAGGHLAIGMGDEITNVGIGGQFQYNIIDPLRLDASLTLFFPKKYGVSGLAESKVTMWDLSVNAHYLFPVSDQVTVYPLAGLGIFGTKVKVDVDLGEWGAYNPGTSDSEFGLNLGGGIDFKLSGNLFLNAEMKYKIQSNWGRFIVSAGLAYKF
jgi:outer membrane protein X